MKNYITEFLGVFLFVTIIGLVTTASVPAGFAPIAIGLALMVMVYATGHISGGHLNPAVTLAVTIRGKAEWKNLPGYWVSQILGAIVAGLLVNFIAPDSHASGDLDITKSFLVEILGTFILAFTVLNVATAKATAGNSFYGLAIGVAVLVSAYAFGSISGGAFNPAVAIGVTVMNAISASNVWIHIVADLVGGVLAAVAFTSLVEKN